MAIAKRAGELTAVWVPDEIHEAIRDLIRARAAAVETLRVHRLQVTTERSPGSHVPAIAPLKRRS